MKTVVSLVTISLLIIFGIYYLYGQMAEEGTFTRFLNPGQEHISCTNEAKVCADGSAVGRTGPNCEFAACPNEIETTDITIKGEMICLPHKNTKGEQTLECAMGIKGDDGLNYGLNDPEWKFLIGVPNGSRVTINGKLKAADDSKYNTAGTIEIIDLKKN